MRAALLALPVFKFKNLFQCAHQCAGGADVLLALGVCLFAAPVHPGVKLAKAQLQAVPKAAQGFAGRYNLHLLRAAHGPAAALGLL